MKKLAIALSAAAALFVLAGCAHKTDSVDNSAAASATSAAPVAAHPDYKGEK